MLSARVSSFGHAPTSTSGAAVASVGSGGPSTKTETFPALDLPGVGPLPPARDKPGPREEDEAERRPRPPARGWEVVVSEEDEDAPSGARGV